MNKHNKDNVATIDYKLTVTHSISLEPNFFAVDCGKAIKSPKSDRTFKPIKAHRNARLVLTDGRWSFAC